MLFESLAPTGFLTPLQTLRALHGEMERLFGAPGREAAGADTFALYTRENEMLLRAALPGVRASDLELEIHDDVLTLKGRILEEPELERAAARHLERPRGTFSRALRLPFEVDAERVEAHLERGVLEVRLPRAARATPRRIQIQPATETH